MSFSIKHSLAFFSSSRENRPTEIDMRFKDMKLLCIQLSTEELATNQSSEDTQRDCVCTVQSMAKADMQYRRCTDRLAGSQSISSLHPFCTVPLQSALRLVLIAVVILSSLHTTAAQLTTQPEVPGRCLIDISVCGLSLRVKYRYNPTYNECESYLGDFCDPVPAGEVNTFSTMEECESICLDTHTEGTEPAIELEECFKDRKDITDCTPEFPQTRFRYESSKNACEAFVSFNVNCEANENNFGSLEECQTQCEIPLKPTSAPALTATMETESDWNSSTTLVPSSTTHTPTVTPTPPYEQTTSTPTMVVSKVMTSPIAVTSPQAESVLNSFDLAIIGIALLALSLLVVLSLLVTMMICKYRKRLKVSKEEVMDSRQTKMIQAYKSNQDPILTAHDLVTTPMHTYFSTV